MEKQLYWVGGARAELAAMPDEARRAAGYDLWLVQNGHQPRDWRPMPNVGPGVMELRVHTGEEFRVFYVAKFAEAIYVLHAFEKRTQTTSARHLEAGRRRHREVIAHRAEAH